MKIAYIDQDYFEPRSWEGETPKVCRAALAALVARIEDEYPDRPILVCHDAMLGTIQASNGATTHKHYGPPIPWGTPGLKVVSVPGSWYEDCWQ
jgi:broad specificity phosphatase PhoE